MHDEQDSDPTSARPRRTRKRSAAEKVRTKQFPQAMRGYDREAVDAWRNEIAELVTRLEEQEPRDSAVRHAIDELGRETAAILQRAHESSADIESRSRSEADARLERADREAEITVREAEERADRLEEDARTVWDQRARLIEEMRQLADEVLGVADDALERVEPPRGRQPESMRGDEESEFLDTVEDEPTLEGEDGQPDGPDTTEEGFEAPDEEHGGVSDVTQVLRSPDDTQASDAAAPDEDSTVENSVPDPQGPERL